MRPPLLQFGGIALGFGAAPLLQDVNFSISAGDRCCLVGRNGSGKSTLLKIAAGLIDADSGTRFLQPGISIRYMAQEPDFGDHATLLSYVEAGLESPTGFHLVSPLLDRLSLKPEATPSHLSGGEVRKAALARALISSPDILLLDEPTNHLDLPTIEWLESELMQSRSALVLISHDRRFLETLSKTTLWLDRGQVRRLEMGFGKFEAWRDDMLVQEEQEQHKLSRKIAMEENWLRYGVTARRKRNVRRLAQLQDLRRARREYRGAQGKATITAKEADKPGTLVIEAHHVFKCYAERMLIKDFSTRIARRDRVGIVGANGSGKTTLLNVLTGVLPPDKGKIKLGTNLQIAKLDQRRESLNPALSLREYLTGGGGDVISVGGMSKHVMSYMRDFLFKPEQANNPLGVLSGGERGRLALARALALPSNMLVLDEPTNDLDLETLDVLEDMLGDYDGTVLVISHDRDFLDRVVNVVITPTDDGVWVEYAGGYTDMLAQRPNTSENALPKAIKNEKKAARPERAVGTQKRRLSFHQKHALDTLPGRMTALQKKIGDFQKKLADPVLYSRDRGKFEGLAAELQAAEDELAKAEENWLELEILRDEIERS